MCMCPDKTISSHCLRFSSVTNTNSSTHRHRQTHTHTDTHTHTHTAQQADGWWAGRGWLAGSEWGRITTLSALWLHCCFYNDPCQIAGMPGCRRSNRWSPSVFLSVYFSQAILSFSDSFISSISLCYLVFSCLLSFSLILRHPRLHDPISTVELIAYWATSFLIIITLQMF